MKSLKFIALSSLFLSDAYSSTTYDLFFTGGQSNSLWDDFAFSKGYEQALSDSGLFTNLIVVQTGKGGVPINNWHTNTRQSLYEAHFFDAGAGNGILEAQLEAIITEGSSYNFRGFSWWQGESDRFFSGANYETYFNNMLSSLSSDIGTTDFNFIINTVGVPVDASNYNGIIGVNSAISNISLNPQARLFDTQTNIYRTDPTDIHGYDHYQVGYDNAVLYLNEFMAIPEPSTAAMSLFGLMFLAFKRNR